MNQYTNGANPIVERAQEKPIKAVVLLTGTGTVAGNVTFVQKSCGEPTLLTIYVTGLRPNAQFGFHVHEKGDLTDHCASLGAHYNPDKVSHGGRDHEVRHVGDLGNLVSNAAGIAETTFSDQVLSLTGSRSIIGRGMIVHEGTDDLGQGGHPDSLKTGNAGGRSACGVIGIA